MRTTVWMMVAAAVLVGCAPAHERSQDTKAIKRLTPQQARELVARYKGQELPLDGLTTLDADVAKALVKFPGDLLKLGGLTTLDADTAKALAAFDGERLWLNGLVTLEPDAAQALSAYKGKLGLRSRFILDADAAKTLEQYKDHLIFMDQMVPPLKLDAD